MKDKTVKHYWTGSRYVIDISNDLSHKRLTLTSDEFTALHKHLSKMKVSEILKNSDSFVIEKRAGFNLSSREVDVIKMLVTGMTAKDIAEKLSISERTVQVHLYNSRKKTGAKNSLELSHIVNGLK